MTKKKILHLDDDDVSRMQLQRSFRGNNEYEIHHVYTSSEFMRCIESPQHWDYFVVDFILKHADGVSLCKLMEPKINGTKIFFLTNYPEDEVSIKVKKFNLKKVHGIYSKESTAQLVERIQNGY